MNSLAPLLPLVGIASLLVIAIRRRRDKKNRAGQRENRAAALDATRSRT